MENTEKAAEPADEELVRVVQAGNIEVFGVLIQRYEKKIGRYARKFLSDKDDTQDVLQEIFTKAYKNIQSFDAGRRFSPWIYRIAHNELVNALKKKKRVFLPVFDLDIFFPQHLLHENTLNQQLERKDTQDLVARCLDKLGDKYREPVILFFIEELSYKEIADVMQIPVATVGTRIKRAKRMMKNFFAKEGYIYQQ